MKSAVQKINREMCWMKWGGAGEVSPRNVTLGLRPERRDLREGVPGSRSGKGNPSENGLWAPMNNIFLGPLRGRQRWGRKCQTG